MPADADVRLRALDPECSFIVQAPAGSGKTELLTRRVLTLLATVDEPEEILAITFTRKAASEMRQRVVETLERSASAREPGNDYEAEGIALARAVLQRDRERDWQLARNPQRLNLRTIDALATQLAHRLPVTSALGAPTGIVENAGALYQEVAERFIESHLDSLHRVMLQLGNRLELAQSLLANLLANRDQWKHHVYAAGDDHDQLRSALEGMLAELVESRLANLCAVIPLGLEGKLLPRLRMAYGFLLQECGGAVDNLPAEVQVWLDIEELPGAEIVDLEGWRGIAHALLTTGFEVRKRLTKAEGFPAATAGKQLGVGAETLKQHKQDMVELLDLARESAEFIECLVEVCKLPLPRYQDDQWLLLSELLQVLPGLLVELQWMFSERGVVDFAEVSERAQRALGPDEAPTDLALSMDLSLKHILVDEFQDTSQTQFRLFQQLVRGWSEGDGRTFFAVGDPMQSIYRFRDGDVALFGQAREQGVGPVRLESLMLTVNFRAAPTVIDWVNQTFGSIFPHRADPDSGAVPYSPSLAHLKTEGQVQVHPLIDQDKTAEAQRVAQIAGDALTTDADHQVAILVRTRGQATEIFSALRAAGLEYQSIDMDLVGERAVVRDLMSLCLALRYPHDRLHWLSLLRAPFVGLTLNDLYRLMDDAGSQAAVVEMLREEERLQALSQDGRVRVDRFMAIIEPALKLVSRGSLMPWVESVWLQLGGPVVCRDEIDVNAAEQAIVRLTELEADGRLWQKKALEEAMTSLYAQGEDHANCRIQVMTLHKAKGLEFDSVILPALDRQPRGDSRQLLNWFESTLHGQPQLLLAPFEQSGLAEYQRDRLSRLVRKARERCDEQEKLRLLYVACTRAKHRLHLVARVACTVAGELRSPVRSSLLHPLWPILEPQFNLAQAGIKSEEAMAVDQGQLALDIEDAISAPLFARLPSAVEFPQLSVFQCSPRSLEPEHRPDNVEFSWAGRTARDIGTVVHNQLQSLAERPELLENPDFDVIRIVAERQLKGLGLMDCKLRETATERVMQAVQNTLADQRGRWVLAAHKQAKSEWALSVPLTVQGMPDEGAGSSAGGYAGARQVVIDRTFVDEAGTRWIIDFKTGDHRGGQVEDFLDREQARYVDQLNGYADIMRSMEQRPTRVGLYFPMLKGWREWEPPATVS